MSAGRIARVLVGALVGCYVAAGVVAAHRAYFPVGSVRIVVPPGPLRANSAFRVDTITSGRGPVDIQIECLRGGRVALLATDRIPSRRWAYWDPRRVFHTTTVTLGPAATGLSGTTVTLRATVTGSRAWLRQPPPVVEELTIRLEGGSPSGAGDERRVGRHENGIRWHMERVFVVLRSRGPAWDDSMPLEGQAGWADHAAFMDDLFAKRFAALVGPLEGTRDALLVLRASHSSEITERLAADPWTSSGHLITKQVSPWQLRLGSL